MKREIPLDESAMEESEGGEHKRATKQGENLTVKMTNLAIGEWGIYQPFHVYTMPYARAQSFIQSGNAELVN
jgi:hypothetical protein